ncbi:MAG TPA: DUF2156 domain-containing protein [Polyangiales bacterium]
MKPSLRSTDLPMSQRDRVLDLVERHGWNATAFQTLGSGYSYFFHGDDACVAYVDTGSAWVAAGAPIATPAAISSCASAFTRAARLSGKRSCFFATEERFRELAGGALRSLLIGEQPSWDPRRWPATLAQHRSLREQLRRARAKGVHVRRATAQELQVGPTRVGIMRVVERWLETRGMAPMEFLVRVDPFTFPNKRACFVAEQDGSVIGFAGVIPVPTRSGWFIENLVRDPDAPNGTSELLVDAVMRWLATTTSTWLTLGLTPLAGDVAGILRLARDQSAWLYDFKGLHAYKAKLRPNAWSPIYLSYPATQSEFLSIVDVLAAFARGGFLLFGIRSLLRAPSVILRARSSINVGTCLGAMKRCDTVSFGLSIGKRLRAWRDPHWSDSRHTTGLADAGRAQSVLVHGHGSRR